MKLTKHDFDKLTPHVDIIGRSIRVGSLVRSFDFPMVGLDGTVLGMVTEHDASGDRYSYVDGIVEAIGEDRMEGCPRYRIRVVRQVRSTREGDTVDAAGGHIIYPPVNGTPSMLGEKTFGVVAL